MAKFNYREIARAVASSPIAAKRVNTIYQNKFTRAKALLLNDFDNHPVTREIEQGVGAPNISETLDGSADLFSFIGFEAGSNPVQPLREVLRDELTLTAGRPTLESNKLKFKFSLRVPTESIKKVTPLPFENAKSWAEGIEKGISGFGQFIRGRFESSRSGGGVQSAHEIRQSTFKKKPYLSELFTRLVKEGF